MENTPPQHCIETSKRCLNIERNFMNVDLEYQEEIIYVSPGVYIGGGGRPVLKHHSYMNI